MTEFDEDVRIWGLSGWALGCKEMTIFHDLGNSAGFWSSGSGHRASAATFSPSSLSAGDIDAFSASIAPGPSVSWMHALCSAKAPCMLGGSSFTRSCRNLRTGVLSADRSEESNRSSVLLIRRLWSAGSSSTKTSRSLRIQARSSAKRERILFGVPLFAKWWYRAIDPARGSIVRR